VAAPLKEAVAAPGIRRDQRSVAAELRLGSLAGMWSWRRSELLRLVRAVPQWAWAFALYLGLAVATIGHAAVVDPAEVCACNRTASDPTIFMWSLSWWPHALLHRLNPLLARVISPPGGVNVAAATAIPAAAIAAWPVTALFGPLVSFNLLAILGPALCGLTAYLLCRRLTAHHAASLMGGFPVWLQ
jgi:hypothetical protein